MAMLNRHLSAYWGFTLSELLISIAIISAIAVFAVSKVITVVETNHKRAVFKETVASLNDVYGQYYMLYDRFPTYDELVGKLNLAYAKQQPIGSDKGCWDPLLQGSAYVNSSYGDCFKLKNGMTIGLARFSRHFMTLDYNGSKPPNVQGKDQIYINFYAGPVYDAGSNPSTDDRTTFDCRFGMACPPWDHSFYADLMK